MATKKKTRGRSTAISKARSAAAKKGWRSRWQKGAAIGKKGIQYLAGREKRDRQKQKREPIREPIRRRWVIEDPIKKTRRRKKR